MHVYSHGTPLTFTLFLCGCLPLRPNPPLCVSVSQMDIDDDRKISGAEFRHFAASLRSQAHDVAQKEAAEEEELQAQYDAAADALFESFQGGGEGDISKRDIFKVTPLRPTSE